MKKLFQRMDQGTREPTTGHTSYLGKSFTVGRYNVTVEDTIAEGKYVQHKIVRRFKLSFFMKILEILILNSLKIAYGYSYSQQVSYSFLFLPRFIFWPLCS